MLESRDKRRTQRRGALTRDDDRWKSTDEHSRPNLARATAARFLPSGLFPVGLANAAIAKTANPASLPGGQHRTAKTNQ